MSIVLLDSNGILIGQVSGDILIDDKPPAGTTYKQVTDAEYWVLDAARVANSETYQTKRAALYPPYQDYIDAQVKMASSDLVMQAAGAFQLNDYVNKCLAVKLQFPKV